MDVQSNSQGWVNLYSATLLLAGVGLEIQNKANNLITVTESATAPADNDFSGRLLRYCDTLEIDAGSPGVWVRANMGTIWLNVQQVPT